MLIGFFVINAIFQQLESPLRPFNSPHIHETLSRQSRGHTRDSNPFNRVRNTTDDRIPPLMRMETGYLPPRIRDYPVRLPYFSLPRPQQSLQREFRQTAPFDSRRMFPTRLQYQQIQASAYSRVPHQEYSSIILSRHQRSPMPPIPSSYKHTSSMLAPFSHSRLQLGNGHRQTNYYSRNQMTEFKNKEDRALLPMQHSYDSVSDFETSFSSLNLPQNMPAVSRMDFEIGVFKHGNDEIKTEDIEEEIKLLDDIVTGYQFLEKNPTQKYYLKITSLKKKHFFICMVEHIFKHHDIIGDATKTCCHRNLRYPQMSLSDRNHMCNIMEKIYHHIPGEKMKKILEKLPKRLPNTYNLLVSNA